MTLMNITLKCNGNYSQEIFEKKFRSAMKAFIYERLKDTKYSLDKSNNNFRGFSFSNIFPIENKTLEKDRIYHLVVRSAYPELIMQLIMNFSIDEVINLGEGSFTLKEIEPERVQLKKGDIIESISPIIIRGKRKQFDFINYEDEPKLFLEFLSNNLSHKYDFYKENNEKTNLDVFENVEIEKVIQGKRNNSFFMIKIEDFDEQRNGEPLYVYGNRLQFKIRENITDTQLEILQKGFESGFGSLASYGFGFMRIVGRGGSE